MSGRPFVERLLEIIENLELIIDKFSPDLVSIEKIFSTNNQKTVVDVLQARGAILHLIAKKQIPFVEYTPTQIKKAVVGNGKATKSQVEWMVKKILNLNTILNQDDASDALAVALCAFYSENLSYKTILK